jgi:hypothetical protein
MQGSIQNHTEIKAVVDERTELQRLRDGLVADKFAEIHFKGKPLDNSAVVVNLSRSGARQLMIQLTEFLYGHQ